MTREERRALYMEMYQAIGGTWHELPDVGDVWCRMEDTVPLDEWEALHGPPLTCMADKEPTPEQQVVLALVRERQQQHLRSIGLLA